MRSLPRPAQRLAGLYVGRQSRLESLTLGETSAWMLAIAAGVPVLAGAWVLLASGLVLSREMTWDLLFNLEGPGTSSTDMCPIATFMTRSAR